MVYGQHRPTKEFDRALTHCRVNVSIRRLSFFFFFFYRNGASHCVFFMLKKWLHTYNNNLSLFSFLPSSRKLTCPALSMRFIIRTEDEIKTGLTVVMKRSLNIHCSFGGSQCLCDFTPCGGTVQVGRRIV